MVDRKLGPPSQNSDAEAPQLYAYSGPGKLFFSLGVRAGRLQISKRD